MEKRHYEQGLISDVLKRLKMGENTTKLSKELNIPYYTIRTWVRRFKLNQVKIRRSGEFISKVVEEIKMGKSLSTIAREKNISIKTLDGWRRKYIKNGNKIPETSKVNVEKKLVESNDSRLIEENKILKSKLELAYKYIQTLLDINLNVK